MYNGLIQSSAFVVLITILAAGTFVVVLASTEAWAVDGDPTQGMRITTGSPETCTSICITIERSDGSQGLPPHPQLSVSSQQYDFVRKWGSLGTDDRQFENVVGIAINSDDKVQEKITLIVGQALTQLLTFNQVLIQRQQTVKIVRHSYHYKVSFFCDVHDTC